MSLYLSACAACGAAYFPPRLRCHRCGGQTFEPMACAEGTVTGLAQVHRVPHGCEFRFLVDIRTAAGPSIVAAARSAQSLGARVALGQGENGAMFVQQD